MTKFLPWEYASSNTIRVADGPVLNPKKITGTRLGAIAGLNHWKSPFGAWCEICRVAEEPFEENKYTNAGIAIEPKLIAWCKENISPHVVTPNEWFKTTQKLYDHFPKTPIFGGMWDALILDGPLGRGKPIGVVEAKTSSRPQDWVDGVPDTYAAQGLMYAALIGVDRVFFPVALLGDSDYDDPGLFKCDDTNTLCPELKTSKTKIRGMSIEEIMERATVFWRTRVVGNESPEFDETADAVFLKILRKSDVPNDNIELLALRAAEVTEKIEAIKSKTELLVLEKELEGLKKQIKPAIIELFKDTDEVVASHGWKVKRSAKSVIDKEALESDNLLEKYTKTEISYTLTKE